MVTRVFPRLALITCIWFEFSLVHCVFYACFDWPLRLSLISIKLTARLKTALTIGLPLHLPSDTSCVYCTSNKYWNPWVGLRNLREVRQRTNWWFVTFQIDEAVHHDQLVMLEKLYNSFTKVDLAAGNQVTTAVCLV